MAYLAPKDYPVVTATAYDERAASGASVDYCLTIINSSVMIKPHVNTSDIGNLTECEVQAALNYSE